MTEPKQKAGGGIVWIIVLVAVLLLGLPCLVGIVATVVGVLFYLPMRVSTDTAEPPPVMEERQVEMPAPVMPPLTVPEEKTP